PPPPAPPYPEVGPRPPRDPGRGPRAGTDHRQPHPKARDPLGPEGRPALDRIRRPSEDADHAFEHVPVVPGLEQEDLQHLAQLALGASIPAPLRALDPAGARRPPPPPLCGEPCRPAAPAARRASTASGRRRRCSPRCATPPPARRSPSRP